MTELIAFGLPQGAEWLIILVVVLLFFGGAKIPQLMRGVGKGVGEFQAGLTQGKRALNKAMEEAAADDEATKGKETEGQNA
jgi:sec-independent protein translocase protein TatA